MAEKVFRLRTSTTGACAYAAYCEPAFSANGSVTATADETGTPDTITVQVAATQGIGLVATMLPATANWPSGTRDVTIQNTSTNMNLTLQSVRICRLNSSCVNQASVGVTTSIGRGMGTAQTVAHSVSWGAQGSATDTDRAILILGFANGAMSTQSVDLVISVATPIEDGGGTTHDGAVSAASTATYSALATARRLGAVSYTSGATASFTGELVSGGVTEDGEVAYASTATATFAPVRVQSASATYASSATATFTPDLVAEGLFAAAGSATASFAGLPIRTASADYVSAATAIFSGELVGQASAVLSGTILDSVTEADIRDGGRTLVLTLSNSTWIAE